MPLNKLNIDKNLNRNWRLDFDEKPTSGGNDNENKKSHWF